jgi:hypothetical protein
MSGSSLVADPVRGLISLIEFLVYRFAVISVIAMALSVPIFACECPTSWPVPPCVAYSRAEMVLIARVLSIKPSQQQSNYGFAVTFDVEQTFKGEETKSVVVYFVGGSCTLPVKVGEKYLVYAERNPQTNKLELQPCGNTIPIASARHALDYIRSLRKGGRGSISAFLVGLSETDMKEVRVAVQGPRGKRWSRPNAIGYYNFENIGPGFFSVRISIPFQVSSLTDESLAITPIESGVTVGYRMSLEKNQCDHREIRLVKRESQNGNPVIEGMVVDSFGKPISGLYPRIYAINSDGAIRPNDYETARTDENGRFTFSKIRPGRYVVAIKLVIQTDAGVSNRLIYFPNASSPEKAEKVDVVPNATRKLEPFILAPIRP